MMVKILENTNGGSVGSSNYSMKMWRLENIVVAEQQRNRMKVELGF